MYICVYVYILYVYMCICVYVYMYMCIRIYVYMYICVYVYIICIVCVYVCACVSVCMYVCMYVCVFTRMYAQAYVYTYVYLIFKCVLLCAVPHAAAQTVHYTCTCTLLVMTHSGWKGTPWQSTPQKGSGQRQGKVTEARRQQRDDHDEYTIPNRVLWVRMAIVGSQSCVSRICILPNVIYILYCTLKLPRSPVSGSNSIPASPACRTLHSVSLTHAVIFTHDMRAHTFRHSHSPLSHTRTDMLTHPTPITPNRAC